MVTVWNRPQVSPRNRTTFAPFSWTRKETEELYFLCFGYSILFSLLLWIEEFGWIIETFCFSLHSSVRHLRLTYFYLLKSPCSSVPQLPGREPSRGPRLLSRMTVLAGTLLRWVELQRLSWTTFKRVTDASTIGYNAFYASFLPPSLCPLCHGLPGQHGLSSYLRVAVCSGAGRNPLHPGSARELLGNSGRTNWLPTPYASLYVMMLPRLSICPMYH